MEGSMNSPREKQQSCGVSFSSHSSSVGGTETHGVAVQGGARKGLHDLFSSYKVTALQDVTIRACLEDEPQWVNLQAGEVVHGLKTVLGVHPNDAPEHRAIHAFGATFVATDTRGLPLPTEFYGVLRVEEEEREAA